MRVGSSIFGVSDPAPRSPVKVAIILSGLNHIRIEAEPDRNAIPTDQISRDAGEAGAFTSSLQIAMPLKKASRFDPFPRRFGE